MSCFQSVPLVFGHNKKFWVGIIGKATGTILWIPKLRSDGGKLHLKPPVVSAGLPAREASASSPHYPHHSGFTGWWFWNMNFYDFSIYWKIINPNWLSYFSEGLKLPTSHHSGFKLSQFSKFVWSSIRIFWSCNELQFCHSNVVSENRGTKHHLVMFLSVFPGQDDFWNPRDFHMFFHCFSNMFHVSKICIFFLSLRWRGLWGFTIQILCSKTGGDAEGVQKGFFLNNQSYN